ncbi:S-layer homology domain-containing protein [Paenibacillus sp. y28]|uniref:S-layer homology domain-containing protein n=1 Tax=Paenibacillus sp. y28 TaxID=3129110 RepID=UPI00301A3D51
MKKLLNPVMKKAVVGSLAVVMLVGGSTAAFADSKGKDNKGRQNNTKVQQPFTYKNWNNNKTEWQSALDKANAKVEVKITFDDMKGSDVEWAVRYIASLASKGVFQGYEDGTFQPRKAISRIEAIAAAVRLMGLGDEAESSAKMNSNLNFKDADKIKSKYPWAVGYVAVALENDLFSETDDAVQPDKEADRLWATTLLVKALKLQDEAKAKMSTDLSFKDDNQIPAGAVGYVAVAVEKGLIEGYENNTFRPNQPVTRAELAALLDRTGGQLPSYQDGITTGTLAAAVSGSVVTLTKSSGETVQIPLHSQVVVYRNGVQSSASALKAGDQLRVYTNNGVITFVEVTKAAEEQSANRTVEGTVNAAVSGSTLLLYSAGQSVQLSLSSDVQIYRQGVRITAAELKVGDAVKAFVYNNKVTFVDVTTPAASTDFSVDVRFQSLTVNEEGRISTVSVTQDVYNSAVSVYTVSPDVTITGDVNQLVQNHEITLQGKNNTVETIIIK